MIRDAGLAEYYERRLEFAPRSRDITSGWETVPYPVQGGVAELTLQVDGLRCASCVWLTEHLLKRTPGVIDARVSYASGRTDLQWDTDAVALSDLVTRIATLGYQPRLIGSDTLPDRDLLVRLGVAAFATMNIMMFSAALYAGWWGPMAPRFVALFQWTSLALATPVALWCAEPFLSGAVTGLRHRLLAMDLPIAVGVVVLYAQSVIGTIRGTDTYVDSLAMLVTLLLVGRVLEARGRRRAAEAALALAAATPCSARRRRGDVVETVAAEDLRAGDLIDVGAGEELAADGTVRAGMGAVGTAMLTGEAEPVSLAPGATVHAGTVLVEGAVTVAVEAAGEATLVSRMADQLRHAADRELRPNSTDRIAPWFTAATLLLATVTFAGWWWWVGMGPALRHAVAVLVVACPCALALSHPLTVAAGLGAAARRGLLCRSGDSLLDLAEVDTLAIDKTGTMTCGTTEVVRADDATLRIAAGIERYSTHPIARAIVHAAVERGIPLPDAARVRETPGRGIEGELDGYRYRVLPHGPGSVAVVRGPECIGVIVLGDQPRADLRDTIQALRRTVPTIALLTGDRREVAHRLVRDLPIDLALAEALPEEKAEWIRDRQRNGATVLFAGDGLNDGPALAQADVGIAMGSGAASSVLVSDGVVSTEHLAPLTTGLRAGALCKEAIRWNQVRSITYNVVAVGAAMAGLINPLIAAVLMPLSSGMVIWGSSRIETRLRREGL